MNDVLYFSLIPYSVQLDTVDILFLNKTVTIINDGGHKK